MYCKFNFFKKVFFNLMMKKKYDKINDVNLKFFNEYCKGLVVKGCNYFYCIVLFKSVLYVESIVV